jgi:DNA-directed RNA polymerase subunit H
VVEGSNPSGPVATVVACGLLNGDASEKHTHSICGVFPLSTKLRVLEHIMVPDHKIMGEEEVASLLLTYKITTEQLPKIYHDDPAVKEIGAKVGDVIRTIRSSHTAGRAESYRLVIKRPKK